MRKFRKFPFVEGEVKQALVACHRHADVDAYCSAYGLYHLLKRIYSRVKIDIASPEGLSIPARNLAKKLPLRTLQRPIAARKYTLLVAVDTGSTELLNGWLPVFRKGKNATILIDHHPVMSKSKTLFKHILVDENTSSSSEMVARLWFEKQLSPPPRVAKALLAGMYTDSRSLTAAGCTTMSMVSKLCELGGSLRWVRETLSQPRDPSESIARLKAAQRMVLTKISGWTLATSLVGAFQASAAKALVDLGADIAAVVGESEGATKGSLRSTQAFYSKSRIHLGTQVVPRLLETAGGGAGGGHPTAASFNVPTSPEECSRKVISILEQLTKELY